jgi:hypothetical protein
MPASLFLAALVCHIDQPGPSACEAITGGWCDVFSATKRTPSRTSSNVSPSIGLNGLREDR